MKSRSLLPRPGLALIFIFSILATARIEADVFEDATSNNAATRRQAISDLIKIAFDPKAFETIKKLISDSDIGVRQAALTSLQYFGDSPAVVELLKTTAKAPDPSIQPRAIFMLRYLGVKDDVIEVLLELAKNQDLAIRRAATFVLTKTDQRRSVQDALLTLAKDENPIVRRMTIPGLSKMAGNEEAKEILVELARSQDEVTAAQAIRALSHFSIDAEIENIFTKKSKSEFPSVRAAAAGAFRSNGNPRLIELLQDPSAAVQIEAIKALRAKSLDLETIKKIQVLLSTAEIDTKIEAVKTLGIALPAVERKKFLLQTLESADPKMKKAATWVIERVEPDQDLEKAIQTLAEKDDKFKAFAAGPLARLEAKRQGVNIFLPTSLEEVPKSCDRQTLESCIVERRASHENILRWQGDLEIEESLAITDAIMHRCLGIALKDPLLALELYAQFSTEGSLIDQIKDRIERLARQNTPDFQQELVKIRNDIHNSFQPSTLVAAKALQMRMHKTTTLPVAIEAEYDKVVSELEQLLGETKTEEIDLTKFSQRIENKFKHSWDDLFSFETSPLDSLRKHATFNEEIKLALEDSSLSHQEQLDLMQLLSKSLQRSFVLEGVILSDAGNEVPDEILIAMINHLYQEGFLTKKQADKFKKRFVEF